MVELKKLRRADLAGVGLCRTVRRRVQPIDRGMNFRPVIGFLRRRPFLRTCRAGQAIRGHPEVLLKRNAGRPTKPSGCCAGLPHEEVSYFGVLHVAKLPAKFLHGPRHGPCGLMLLERSESGLVEVPVLGIVRRDPSRLHVAPGFSEANGIARENQRDIRPRLSAR